MQNIFDLIANFERKKANENVLTTDLSDVFGNLGTEQMMCCNWRAWAFIGYSRLFSLNEFE